MALFFRDVQGPMSWWWPGSKWLCAWSTSAHTHIAIICCNPPTPQSQSRQISTKFERITHCIRCLVSNTRHIRTCHWRTIQNDVCVGWNHESIDIENSMRISTSLQGLHLVSYYVKMLRFWDAKLSILLIEICAMASHRGRSMNISRANAQIQLASLAVQCADGMFRKNIEQDK